MLTQYFVSHWPILSYVLTQYFVSHWPIAFLIVSQPLWIFMISSYKIRLFCFPSLALAPSLLSTWVSTSKVTSKKTWPCDFFPNKTLSCIWVAIPVDWIILYWYACGADGRSVYGHVITKFSRMGSLPLFLPMVVRARELRYYMAAWGYEFYLQVLKVSREILSAREDKSRIPRRPCNVLFIYRYWWNSCIKHNLKLICRCICGEESVDTKSYPMCELSLNQ